MYCFSLTGLLSSLFFLFLPGTDLISPSFSPSPSPAFCVNRQVWASCPLCLLLVHPSFPKWFVNLFESACLKLFPQTRIVQYCLKYSFSCAVFFFGPLICNNDLAVLFYFFPPFFSPHHTLSRPCRVFSCDQFFQSLDRLAHPVSPFFFSPLRLWLSVWITTLAVLDPRWGQLIQTVSWLVFFELILAMPKLRFFPPVFW